MISSLMIFVAGTVATLLLVTGGPPSADAQEEPEVPRTQSDTTAEREGADPADGTANAGEPLHIEIYKRVSRPVIDGNRVDRFGKQITGVSARQIEDLNAQDLPSALRRTPGVVISRHNPIGSFGGGAGGAVFIRGMGAERPGAGIQTLIDGVPVFVGVWTHPLMDLLSVDIVERMDVHKGAEPLRFGNMAFGAVNLIPKRQTEEGYSGRLRLAGGSYSTFVQTAEHGGRRGPLDWYLVQSYRTSDGHRRNADGELQAYFGRANYRIGENVEASLLLSGTNNYANDPGPRGSRFLNDGRFETQNLLSIATISHEHDWGSGSIKGYWDNGDLEWTDQFNSIPIGARTDTLTEYDNYGVHARETLTLWQGGELLVGLDVDRYGGEVRRRGGNPPPPADFDRRSYLLLGPHAGVNHRFELPAGWFVIPSAGIRGFLHDEYSNRVGPQAGLVIGREGTTLHFNWSRGINYPGVYVETLNTIAPFSTDLSDLTAERLDHFEIGVQQELGGLATVGLVLFLDDGEDRLIQTSPPPPFAFQNVPDFRTRGIEATAEVRPVEDLALFAGVTYLDANPGTLPYAPDWQVTAGLNYRFFERFRLSVDGLWVDDYLQATVRSGTSSRIDDYFVLNARLGYLLPLPTQQVAGEVFIAGENLTDSNYELKQGYPMPGASVMGGLSVSF